MRLGRRRDPPGAPPSRCVRRERAEKAASRSRLVFARRYGLLRLAAVTVGQRLSVLDLDGGAYQPLHSPGPFTLQMGGPMMMDNALRPRVAVSLTLRLGQSPEVKPAARASRSYLTAIDA